MVFTDFTSFYASIPPFTKSVMCGFVPLLFLTLNCGSLQQFLTKLPCSKGFILRLMIMFVIDSSEYFLDKLFSL